MQGRWVGSFEAIFEKRCPKYEGRGAVPSIPRSSAKLGDMVAPGASNQKFDSWCFDILNSSEVQRAVRHPRAPPVDSNSLHGGSFSPQLEMPTLFRSLCILNPSGGGHPIQFRSKYYSIGPRGLKAGSRKLANSEYGQADDAICSLSARLGPDGRPMFVLEYASSLISQESREVKYVLGAQMDVTDVVRKLTEAAIQAQLKTHPCSASASPKTPFSTSQHPSIPIDCEFNLLMRPFNSEQQELFINAPDFERPESPMDWSLAVDSLPSTCSSSIEEPWPCVPPYAVLALERLMRKIQSIHRSAFTLSSHKSLAPAASHEEKSSEWQISYISPSLASRPLDLRAALSCTSIKVLGDIGAALTRERPVAVDVKWGAYGEDVRMYCSPMFKDNVLGCWVCLLVDWSVRGCLSVEWERSCFVSLD